MLSTLLSVATFGSALGCGLIAGVFFAFSNFVMKALSALPAAQGIAAMQSINRVVLNPLFLGTFVGTAATCLVSVVCSLLLHGVRPGIAWVLLGAAFYLVGTFLVTRVFSIPRNDTLAAVDPASAESARSWAEYVASWTAWNHVRTLAALLAAAAFIAALWVSPARVAI